MRRLLGNVLSKALTGKSINDRNQENLRKFCNNNGLSNLEVEEYRLDRDPIDPRFMNTVFIGTCIRGNKRYGLIVTVDENTGWSGGRVFIVKDRTTIQNSVKQYKRDPQFYRSYMSYFLNEICDGKFEELSDGT